MNIKFTLILAIIINLQAPGNKEQSLQHTVPTLNLTQVSATATHIPTKQASLQKNELTKHTEEMKQFIEEGKIQSQQVQTAIAAADKACKNLIEASEMFAKEAQERHRQTEEARKKAHPERAHESTREYITNNMIEAANIQTSMGNHQKAKEILAQLAEMNK